MQVKEFKVIIIFHQAFKAYVKDQLDKGKDPIKTDGEDVLLEWKDLPKSVQQIYLDKF